MEDRIEILTTNEIAEMRKSIPTFPHCGRASLSKKEGVKVYICEAYGGLCVATRYFSGNKKPALDTRLMKYCPNYL